MGQSEYQVAGMVDFFLVLMLPGGGDELQGIKRGIMELADALVINKADGDSAGLAEMTRRQYTSAMNLLRHTGFWTPRVMTCSALEGRNIDAVWSMVVDYYLQALDLGVFHTRRAEQNRDWMHQLVNEMLMLKLRQNPEVKQLLPRLEREVENHETTAYAAARKIIEQL